MLARNKALEQSIQCPICGNNNDFDSVNNRDNARCRVCLSMERTRLLYLLLYKMNVLKKGMKVMHIAPEAGLRFQLYNIFKEDYHACDFDISRYDNQISPIYKIDLCNDIQRFPSNTFDIIIHNHVIEHLPIPLTGVFHHLQRILKPNGYHFFTIPVIKGWTSEDIHETDPRVREQRFLQDDHYRIFGTEDVVNLIKNWTGTSDPVIKVSDYLTEKEVIDAGIPLNDAFSTVSAMTPFLVRK